MGLAPFFEKAALAGSHLLQNFESETFARILLEHTVVVAFDEQAATSKEGRTTLDLTVNLLARLYPSIALAPLGGSLDDEVERLTELARSINPHIDIAHELNGSSALVVGTTAVDLTIPTFYMGSDSWVTGFSPDSPVGSGDSDNPFGACAAACFGAANIFRTAFAAQLPQSPTDTSFQFSLLAPDDRVNLLNPAFEQVDLGATHLVGLGAIGNAAVWSLARAPFVTGTLHLIDHEEVDLTNLQRYVLTSMGDIGQSKVLLAQNALVDGGIRAEPHAVTWGEYMAQRGDWQLERVATALDTPEDRCLVQAALPRWIANAWTQPEDLGVSRHTFAQGQACLMCLYLRDEVVPDLDDQIVSALHLPDDHQTLMEVRMLLVNEQPIGPEWVERIAQANGVSAERLHGFAELPMRSFYQRALCGGVMLSLGAQTDRMPRNTEVPMAFQSALAGILLTAQLVAHASSIETPHVVTTKINLLKPLGTYLSLPAPQHSSGRCICQDPDYVDVYRRKYGHPHN